MTQKVFELAKEFNLSAIDLVEKLRSGGLNVRNHMVTLSADELNVALNILRPPVSVKKEAKKIVKKVVKKVVTSKAKESDDESLNSLEPELAKERKSKDSSPDNLSSDSSLELSELESSKFSQNKKNVTVKRRTKNEKDEIHLRDLRAQNEEGEQEFEEDSVDAKRHSVDDQELGSNEEQQQVTQEPRKSSPREETQRPPSDRFREDRPRGLEIVSRPVIQPRTVGETGTAAAARGQSAKLDMAALSPEEKKKVLFKEKMHTFTPVFVPEAKEGEGKSTGSDAGKPRILSKPGQVNLNFMDETTEEDSDKGDKSKKRFGDLAAIVSRKVGEKNIDLNYLRAEEELKFASSIVGAGIYAPAKRKKIWTGEKKNTLITEVKDAKRIVVIHGSITVADLAQKLSVKFEALADQALKINLLLAANDDLGFGLASQLAALYQYRVENRAFDETKILQASEEEEEEKLSPSTETKKGSIVGTVEKQNSAQDYPIRNPIIAIMGHVDHGKTSLLDFIRKEKVADSEAGGITQHIGAYSVKVKDSTLTFLDTPGHAAFATMRQRGANVTDIVVLVVAADDGVMPQTVESIKFIKNAASPMIVAINKIDKEGSKPEKIKQDLMQYGVTPEEWGGDTQFVEISALKGLGIDKLLEGIQVQAEMMELRENPNGFAECIVIESKLETGRGPVCTVIVKKGTLKKGDAIVCGECSGRARSLMDFVGKNLDEALPSTPVQILGLDTLPSPGDKLNVVANEREAKKIVENRINERKSLESVGKKVHSMEDFFNTQTDGNEKKVLRLIVRADVLGSFEAIKSSLEAQANDEVSVEVVSGGAGPITENDVMMASSTKGYIIGFNMRPVTSARKLAEDKAVEIKTYTIIYELIDDVKLALEGLLAPEKIETYIGRAQVKEVFNIPKIGAIAGSQVVDGKMERHCNIRLLRDGKIVHDGKLSSLKRFKDDVKEVKNGLECGIALESFNDVKAGDIFEAYLLEEKKRKFEARPVTL